MTRTETFIKEFKAFAIKGNVVDLAVAVIIGAAFGKIVSSLVDTIIMPSLGLLLGGLNFSSLRFEVGDSVIAYGVFIQNVIDFTIIAFVIFIAVRMIRNAQKTEEKKPEKEKIVEPSEEVKLLRDIRDALEKKRE